MPTTLSDDVSSFFARLPGITPGGAPPRARLPGEDDRIGTGDSAAPAPEPDARPVSAPWWVTHKTQLMVAAGMLCVIGSAGMVMTMHRAAPGAPPGAAPDAVPAAGSIPASSQSPPTTHPPVAVVAVEPAGGAATHPPVPQPPATTAARPVAPPPAPLAHPQLPATPAVATGAAAAGVPAGPAPASGAQAQLTQFEALKPDTPTLVVTPPKTAATGSNPVTPPVTPPARVAMITPSGPTSGPTSGPPTPDAKAAVAGPATPTAGGAAVTAAVTPVAAATRSSLAPPAGQAPDSVGTSAGATNAGATHGGATNTVAQAVAVRAAPMAAPQQIVVLHLVTELGVLVRDQRSQIAALRGQVARLSRDMKTGMTGFDRRLSIAEATGAISAAMGAGQKLEPPTTPPGAPVAQPVAQQVAQTAPAPAVAQLADYHIQAASPGLAMLTTEVGGENHITVGVGDEVPGIGRVRGIFQKGTNWVVETDHGVISR